MVLLIILLLPGLPLKAETNHEDPAGEQEILPGAVPTEAALPTTLAVYYHETARKSMPASPDHINAEISSISPREVNRDSEIYIREDTQAVLKIQTGDFDSKRLKVSIYEEDYRLQTRKDVTSEYYNEKKWTESGDNAFLLPILFRKEGHFQLEIDYQDPGGLGLEPALETQAGCFYGGTYVGPHLTVDKKDPEVLSMTPSLVPLAMEGEVPCFEECPEYELLIEEENFHPGNFRWKKGGDKIAMSEWSVFYEEGRRKNRVSFSPKEEGFYSLPYEILDGSGRKCSGSLSFLVDRSSPELKISVDPGSPCFRYSYEDFPIISGSPMTFSLEALDPGSGIRSIRYMFLSPEGKAAEEVMVNEGKEKDFRIKIQLPREDFCGWITAACTDRMGHSSRTVTSPVFLWESRGTFDARKSLKISYSQAVYTDEENRIKYYREAPVVRAEGANEYAGVRESYLKVSQGEDGQTRSQDYRPAKKITSSFQQEFVLSPEDYEDSCRDKPAKVLAGFQDNAGYETRKKGRYGIVVDHLPPEITVEFREGGQAGAHPEGAYYKEAISAIVTVTDWNFNPSATCWKISGRPGGYHLGNWHGEGRKHWCRIDFQSDGTYGFGLTASDYSGNSASYHSGEEFTIDRTPPQVLLWMDQSKACHKKYYSGTEMVYILVKEDNGSKDMIHLNTGKGAEGKITPVYSSSLSFLRENEKRGWKIYSYEAKDEGTYRLSCYCEDRAGNRSGKKTLAPFVVDKTPPRIDWQDLREGFTFTGKVTPKITVLDSNLDDSRCRLDLCYGDGSRAINLERYLIMTGKKHQLKTFHCSDFPREKKYDNKYLMRISACDLAGNQLEEGEISFCVDRFGARYQLPEETAAYLENYYNNQEQDISVTAYSLHPLETEILINYNREDLHELGPEDYEEKAEILREGEEKDNPVLPAIHEGWYQTTYTIAKEVFGEEGDYNITLRSREEEGKTESETILWTGPIGFAIDKTPPNVMIGGLDQENYVASRKEYTVTALDNMRLKKVRLSLRKEEEPRGKTILLTEKDFRENHSITSELASYKGYQILSYDAWDYAGNKISAGEESGEKRVLVSDSPLFLFYHKHRLGLALWLLFISLLAVPGILLTRRYFFGILEKIFFSEKGR